MIAHGGTRGRGPAGGDAGPVHGWWHLRKPVYDGEVLGPSVGCRTAGRRAGADVATAAADPAAAPRGESGFALISVLLVLALLGVIGAEFAFSMRLEAATVRAYRDGVIGAHLAEAAAEQAIYELMTEFQLVGIPEGQPLTFFRSPGEPIPRLPRESVWLGSGHFSYRITDEESLINVNTASDTVLAALLTELQIEKRVRDIIVDSIQDWKDANEEHRLNGAESDDTYLKLRVPYRSRNANLEDLGELLQIKGVTPEIFHGREGRPGLKDYVSVRGRGQVNINTAPETVLRALGLSRAEVSTVIQTRQVTPYAAVPGTLTGRGLIAASRTFRIEAEGRVGSERPARLIVIVERRANGKRTANVSGPRPEIDLLSWRPQPGTAGWRSAL